MWTRHRVLKTLRFTFGVINTPAGTISLLLTHSITFVRQKSRTEEELPAQAWEPGGLGLGQLACITGCVAPKLLQPRCASVSSTKNEDNNSVDPIGCEDFGSYYV